MFKVPKNMAVWDRALRFVIAFFMIGGGIFFADWIGDPVLQWLAIGFGAFNIFAGASGFCLVYKLANISTR